MSKATKRGKQVRLGRRRVKRLQAKGIAVEYQPPRRPGHEDKGHETTV